MYQIGEYLVYGFEGVCRVEEIGQPKMYGIDRQKLYYTLVPLSGSGAIFTPVDTGAYIRYPISRQEAEDLLACLPKLPLCADLPADPRSLSTYYQEVLHSHDCKRIAQLYKTLFRKQLSLTGTRKTLSATDLRYLKQTEELLRNELSFSLDCDSVQVTKLLHEQIKIDPVAPVATPAP